MPLTLQVCEAMQTHSQVLSSEQTLPSVVKLQMGQMEMFEAGIRLSCPSTYVGLEGSCIKGQQ